MIDLLCLSLKKKTKKQKHPPPQPSKNNKKKQQQQNPKTYWGDNNISNNPSHVFCPVPKSTHRDVVLHVLYAGSKKSYRSCQRTCEDS